MLLVLGISIAASQYNSRPLLNPEALVNFEGPLSVPIHRWYSRRTSFLAPVSLSDLKLRITNLCDLWSCELPPGIRSLRRGDVVSGLRAEDEIVELAKGDVVLLSQAQWIEARNVRRQRGIRTGLWMAAGGAAILALGLWIRARP